MATTDSEARDRAAGVTAAVLSALAPLIRFAILTLAVFSGVVLVVWLILAANFHLHH